MKEEVGIVTDYNGYSGRISSNDVEYLLLDTNVLDNEVIEKDDKVRFVPERKEDVYIARFVRKKEKKML